MQSELSESPGSNNQGEPPFGFPDRSAGLVNENVDPIVSFLLEPELEVMLRLNKPLRFRAPLTRTRFVESEKLDSAHSHAKILARMRMLLAFCVFTLVGCSHGDRPDIGQVRGVVTINGAPAEGLGILFSQKGFRSSSGRTNAAGEYELKYIKDAMGAAVGSHKVRIEYVTQEGAGPRRGRIPPRYNRKTELTARVEPGWNEFNFDLKLESKPTKN